MKKLYPKVQLRQIRIARLRARQRFLRFGRRHVTADARYVPPGELLVAPPRFNVVRGDGARVVRFLRATANAVLRQRTPVRLDFRRVESIYVAGAILLVAEIERIVSLSDLPKPITIIDPQHRRPREVLKQIGIHQLTGDRCDVIPTRDDVVFWRATKGSDQSGETLGPILQFVAETANREHVKKVELSGIWRGVSEAVANAVDHAYSAPRGDGHQSIKEPKWWMFTQIRDGVFTAAVCDLGCGYRATVGATIPEEFRAKIANLLFGKSVDASAIQLAMEYGRSGTDETHRGKGSRDALSVLARHGDGELNILSNRGWMNYRFSGGKEMAVQSNELDVDIKGTIVWWKLPLEEAS